MRIWRLNDPEELAYARYDGTARRRKTDSRSGLCPVCTAPPRRERAPGIEVAWVPGSDKVGDFVWDISFCCPLVQQRVFDALREKFVGIEAWPIEMVQTKTKPKRMTKRTKPRVWLPYEGPPLVELRATTVVPVNWERSTIRIERACDHCGYVSYRVEGVERHRSRFDKSKMELISIHDRRRTGEGVFINSTDLGALDFFYIKEWTGEILCTDEAKAFMEERGYTNVRFLEAGDVI